MMATSFVPFIKLFLCDTMQTKKTTFNVQLWLYSNNSLETVVFKEAILELQTLLYADLVVIAKKKNTGE